MYNEAECELKQELVRWLETRIGILEETKEKHTALHKKISVGGKIKAYWEILHYIETRE